MLRCALPSALGVGAGRQCAVVAAISIAPAHRGWPIRRGRPGILPVRAAHRRRRPTVRRCSCDFNRPSSPRPADQRGRPGILPVRAAHPRRRPTVRRCSCDFNLPSSPRAADPRGPPITVEARASCPPVPLRIRTSARRPGRGAMYLGEIRWTRSVGLDRAACRWRMRSVGRPTSMADAPRPLTSADPRRRRRACTSCHPPPVFSRLRAGSFLWHPCAPARARVLSKAGSAVYIPRRFSACPRWGVQSLSHACPTHPPRLTSTPGPR